MPRQRYRIDWYQGRISSKTRVEHTTVWAMDTPHARKFGMMRRPGLIVVVTPKSVGKVEINGGNK